MALYFETAVRYDKMQGNGTVKKATSQDEEWCDIPGYEGLYQVSSMGRVRSLERIVSIRRYGKTVKPHKAVRHGRTMKTKLCRGYRVVQLSHNGVVKFQGIHRLVAMAFIPNPSKKPAVNHIDGIKTNNVISNLEWVTYSENELHSYHTLGKKANKTRLGRFGKDCYNHHEILQLSRAGEIVAVYESRGEAHRKTGISSGNIWLAMNGKRKTAGGYFWRYK